MVGGVCSDEMTIHKRVNYFLGFLKDASLSFNYMNNSTHALIFITVTAVWKMLGYNIVVPISKTNISALFLIEFIYIWNQYLWPLIVANAEATRVIQIGLKQLIDTDAAVDWNIVMSGAALRMIPPLIILILFQSSLIKGLSMAEEK